MITRTILTPQSFTKEILVDTGDMQMYGHAKGTIKTIGFSGNIVIARVQWKKTICK